jgi:hypothetical protein
MSDDTLIWLQRFYLSCCDGDWEHGYGVAITTLDNPGWAFEFELSDTDLAGASFEPLNRESSDNDWVHCRVEEGKFKGRCGPENLIEVLTVFRTWVEAKQPKKE